MRGVPKIPAGQHRVEDGLVEELPRCLRLEVGELPLGNLPASEPQELTCFGSRDTGDVFIPFIESCQNAGGATWSVLA
jgi:hypothetical protein